MWEVWWLTSVIFRDGSENLAHGRLPLGLVPLHVVQLHQDRVDLGNDRPDRLLHPVHSVGQSGSRISCFSGIIDAAIWVVTLNSLQVKQIKCRRD